MHAYRIHILYPSEVLTCRRRHKRIHRPHMLPFQTIKEYTLRQWNQIQKQVMARGIRETENRTKIHTHLLTTVQWQN